VPTLTKDVWELSEQDFPRSGPIETQLRFLVRYAILAPSVKNTQPWGVAADGNRVQLFAALNRDLPVTDPDQRELFISLGCALENLLVAAEHFGFQHETAYLPVPGSAQLAATITFSPGGTPSPARAGIALAAILKRHNDNSVYRPASVPERFRAQLEACCVEPELRLDLTVDHFFRRWIEAFTLEADRVEFEDAEFRREIGHWISQGVLGTGGLMARLGGLAVSRLDLGEVVAIQDQRIVASAALLGLISATDDTHLAHLRTGQLFERIWLTATTLGVSIHPMSQTMRRPKLRALVSELLPTGGWIPQHLFRVGYSSMAPRHTPRLPLGDVLTE
jgi:hypothetical protein